MLDVNLRGAVAWLDPAAERFSRLGGGAIVGIGSVAGDRGRSGNPVYCTSKAGLHTYLEAIRNRVARDGVRVVTIKPGFVDTAMTRGLEGLFWLISADRAAEIILRKAKRGATVAYVPARWRWVMLVIRSIPSFIFRRLEGLMMLGRRSDQLGRGVGHGGRRRRLPIPAGECRADHRDPRIGPDRRRAGGRPRGGLQLRRRRDPPRGGGARFIEDERCAGLRSGERGHRSRAGGDGESSSGVTPSPMAGGRPS